MKCINCYYNKFIILYEHFKEYYFLISMSLLVALF